MNKSYLTETVIKSREFTHLDSLSPTEQFGEHYRYLGHSLEHSLAGVLMILELALLKSEKNGFSVNAFVHVKPTDAGECNNYRSICPDR